jgi:uncharacterized protein (TIGR00369 family)
MDILEIARQIFAAQPFSQHIGAELESVDANGVELRLRITDAHKQQHGFVHGGVISYLADNSITFAGGLALRGNALTAEYKISYLRPATGSHLVARASAKGVGKRQAVCQAEIYAVDERGETLCAIALGTVVKASD